MKTLMTILFLALLNFLTSCGGEDADPAPQYNCEQLATDVKQAKAKWQAHVDNIYAPNYTQQYKDQWHATESELKQALEDAVTLQSKHCK